MASTSLPTEFQNSCLDYLSYPDSLITDGIIINHMALKGYKIRFEAMLSSLCVKDETDSHVPIRELNGSSESDLRKNNLQSMASLDQWLGIHVAPSEKDPLSRVVTTQREDPKSRFIYLFAEHSRSRLRVTHGMLARILTYHQVMPEYIDLLFTFGSQLDPRDLRFGAFFSQSTFDASPSQVLQILGRSGQQFQLCYNLKGVTQKDEDEDRGFTDWTIRAAAIYHQFDIVHGTAVWIVTKGRLDLQQRYKHLTGFHGRPEDKRFDTMPECLRSSLSAHLMFCQWSVEDWRWYILWIENAVEDESQMAQYGFGGRENSRKKYTPSDIQSLHNWKDKIGEAALILESNVDVMTSLRNHYTRLLTASRVFDQDKCRIDVQSFAAKLDEITGLLRMLVARAKYLENVVNDRKDLVTYHFQDQATERAERLNLHLEGEAILMRIVTIVTLFYLPATFVSTFFSTDIVKYQDPNGGEPGLGNFSSLALTRWFQTTVPLTLVTIFISFLAYWRADKARERRGQTAVKQRPRGFGFPKLPSIWQSLRIPRRTGSSKYDLPLHTGNITKSSSPG